jgi:hypothetical protein
MIPFGPVADRSGEMKTAAERVYRIKSSDYWHTGHTNDGTQVLFGLLCPDLVAYLFNQRGDLIDIQLQRLEFMVEDQKPGQPFDIYDPRIESRRKQWSRKLGIRRGTINIRQFSDPEHDVKIENQPGYFNDVLERRDGPAEEKARIEELRQNWETEKNFVLWWGNDYWIGEDGEVESS